MLIYNIQIVFGSSNWLSIATTEGFDIISNEKKIQIENSFPIIPKWCELIDYYLSQWIEFSRNCPVEKSVIELYHVLKK